MASMKTSKPQGNPTPKVSLGSSKPQQSKAATGGGSKPAATAKKAESKPQAATAAGAKPAAGSGCCQTKSN